MTRGWLLTHALVIGVVLLFLRLSVWQLQRGESGNLRSYAYAMEWPTFALLVIVFWVKIVHDELRHTSKLDIDGGTQTPVGQRDGGPLAAAAGIADCPSPSTYPRDRAGSRAEEDAELAAYNRYVADLAEQRRHQ